MKESMFKKYSIIEFINFETIENNDVNAPIEVDEVIYSYHFGNGCYRSVIKREKNGFVTGLVSRRIPIQKFLSAYDNHINSRITPIFKQ